MKKMKSLTQQMMTVLSLALVAMTITVCGPEQALANGKGRAGAAANVRQRNNPGQRSQNGKGIIMANTEGDFHIKARRQTQPARSNNLTVNAGSGNDMLNVQARTAKPNRLFGDWNGDRADTLGRRRNLIGSPEYFKSYGKPKSNLTATTYGRGSFAKARGKQGR